MADSNSLQMTSSNSLQMTASNSAQMTARNPTDETTVLVLVEGNYRVYRRRYYILFLFSMYNICVGISMNAFNPIARSMNTVFCIDSSEIAFLNLWSTALVLLFFVPTGIIMQKFGLRVCMVTFGFLTTVGVSVRCLVWASDKWKICRYPAEHIFNVGQFLGGLCQVFSQLAPPAISATWFPPRQRNMATAFGSTAITVGNGLVYLIEPIIVDNKFSNYAVNCSNISTHETYVKHTVSSKIFVVFILQLVFTAIVLIAIVVYFPGKPPTPPSPTQAENMGPIKPALKKLARNKDYWLLSIGVYFMFGIYLSWLSLLNLNLNRTRSEPGDPNPSEDDVGKMVFSHNIGAIIGSGFFGILADRFKRRHKRFMVLFFLIGAITMILYYLQYAEILRYGPSFGLLYVVLVFMGVSVVGTLPLVTEVLAEISHPVSENIILIFPMILQNSSNSLTLLISWLHYVVWLNTCWLVGAICIPIYVLIAKVQYKRSDYDNYTL